MGKIRQHKNQVMERCVELHKSGNVYKNRYSPENGHIYRWRWVREAKQSPKITVGELQNYRGKKHLGVQNSPKLPLDMTSMPTNDLEGMNEKSLSCHFTTNVSAWSSLKATGTLTGTVFYDQLKEKCSFLATNTQVGLV